MKKFLAMCLAVLALVNVTVYADTTKEEIQKREKIFFKNSNDMLVKNYNGEYVTYWDFEKGEESYEKLIIYNGEIYANYILLDSIIKAYVENEENGIYRIIDSGSNIGTIDVKIDTNENIYDFTWKGIDVEVEDNSRFQTTSITLGKNKFSKNVTKRIKGEKPIINQDGITYFPVRAICELLGDTVTYDYYEEDNTKYITVTKPYRNDDYWDNKLDYAYRTGEYNAKSSNDAKVKINVKFPALKSGTTYITVMNGLLRIEAERYAESIYKQYADSETDVKINAELNWVYGKNDIISIEYGIKGKPETYFGKSIYVSAYSDKYGITNICDYIEDCKIEYIFCKDYYDSFETPIAPLAAINHVFIRDDEDKYILNLAKNKLKEEINKNPDKYYENAAEIIDKSDFNGQIYLKNDGVAIFCKPGEVADKALGYIRAELKENEISMTENPLEGVYRYYTDSAIRYYVFNKDGKSYTYMSTEGGVLAPNWQYRIDNDIFYEKTANGDKVNKHTYTKTEEGFILDKGTTSEYVFEKLNDVDADNFKIMTSVNSFYYIQKYTDFLKDKSDVRMNYKVADENNIILEISNDNENIVFRAKVNAITGECINLENNEKINLWDFKK